MPFTPIVVPQLLLASLNVCMLKLGYVMGRLEEPAEKGLQLQHSQLAAEAAERKEASAPSLAGRRGCADGICAESGSKP